MAGAVVSAAGLSRPQAQTQAPAPAPPQASAQRGRLRRAVAWVAREPFFQFIALGALLFAASEYLEARAAFARIDITRAEVEGIRNNYRLQYGVSPTAEQLDALVDQFIREEVYYHEALRLKLGDEDEIVRRRLVQKFGFLQQDLAAPADPGEAELQAFYRSHLDRYTVAERLTFSHVFFSVDRGGEEEARARALRTLPLLEHRNPSRAPEYGDPFPGAVDYAGATPTQVRRAFGGDALAEALDTAASGRWVGPLRSGFGWHLVFLTGREPAGIARYEDVRETVRRDAIDAQREARNRDAYERLRRHFNIVRDQ